MKKRFIGLILVLVLILAGCGGDGRDQVSGNLEPAATSTTPVIPETTGNLTTAPETTAPAEENPVSMGVLEGGTYTNEYVGFGCELDDTWTIYPAEMLQELPENLQGIFNGTELEGLQLDQFTDIMAENTDLMANFNVLYQKLSVQDRLAYSLASEEEILDAILSMYDTLVAAYANAGITVEKIEKVTVTFLGEERTALHTTASAQGIAYYTLQIFDYRLGAYSVTTTFASFVEDNTQSMLELFYPLS